MNPDITQFVYVRHGETVANINSIVQGQQNSQLTENGIAQAKAAAEALRDTVFHAAYASDMDRTRATAQEILALHKEVPDLVLTTALREWNCGKAEGSTWEWLRDNYPLESKAFTIEQNDVRLPGGESRSEFQKRVSDFLDETALRHRGQTVLLVSHGGTLQRIFRKIAGVIAEGNLIPLAGNASISTFVYDFSREAWQLTSWNCREHLKALPEHITKVL